METNWQKIANNCKISEITKYGKKIKTFYKNIKKCQKRAKNGKQMATCNRNCFIVFLARNYLKKLIQRAETAKNGFKCLKMHSI